MAFSIYHCYWSMFPNMNIALHLRRELLNYKDCTEACTCHPKRWTYCNIDACKNIKNKAVLCTIPKCDIWLSTSEPKLQWDLEGWQTDLHYTNKWNFTLFVPHLSYYYSAFLSYLSVFFFLFLYFSLQIYTFPFHFVLFCFIFSFFCSSSCFFFSRFFLLSRSFLSIFLFYLSVFLSSCFVSPSFVSSSRVGSVCL